jgi:nucleotidyltransferase/DNA polymerase involved in DNA repair
MQVVSIDEAFLDITGCLLLHGGKRELARAIQQRILTERELTVSLGVAPNKLVAKIASDLRKPRGLVVVEPAEVVQFLRPLEVKRIPGVGPKMQLTLSRMGIRTIGQLADVPPAVLDERFGKWGQELVRKARGQDDSPVQGGSGTKSIGHEHTFAEDTADMEHVRATLTWLCEKTARRLRKSDHLARTVTTKVRFADFTTFTRQRTLAEPVRDAGAICKAALANLALARVQGRELRLIGVSVSGLVGRAAALREPQQTFLFDDNMESGTVSDARARLTRAEDAVKDRFGDDAIRRGDSFVADGQ